MVSNGKAQISENLSVAILCKNMKWDYYTYYSQPQWFIDLIRLVFNLEAEQQNRIKKSMDRRSRRKK